MLILFAVLWFVAIVGLGVTIFKKNVKNGIFIRKVGIFHDLNINETNFKLSYEEFCALVANGGKIIKEEKYNSI